MTDPTPPEAPEPCPWCGSSTTVLDMIGGFSFAVTCDNLDSPGCAVEGPNRPTPAEAVTAWDRVVRQVRRAEELEQVAREGNDPLLKRLDAPVDHGGFDGWGPDELHRDAANAIRTNWTLYMAWRKRADEAEAEVAALRATVERLEGDGERLDWLERKTRGTAHGGVTFNYFDEEVGSVMEGEPNYHLPAGFQIGDDSGEPYYQNVREAIDAARATPEGGTPNG